MQTFDIAIIGSGPAGYTSALYTSRANKTTCVIKGRQPGGQLMLTHSIENYPGIIDSGFGLMNKMEKQAIQFGTQTISDHVTNIAIHNNLFTLTCQKTTITAKAVIIATGSTAKWLNLPNEKNIPQISTCATCDGFAYKNKHVAIIGGGNTAVEDALYLSNLCTHITLIHRRDTLKAEQISQDKLFKLPNISFKWHTQITSYLTDQHNNLTGLTIQSTLNPSSIETLTISGLFIAIGHTPNTDFIKNLVHLTEHGYIPDITTNIPGLFAAGDVMDPIDKQAITAAGYGCIAARRALHYLTTLE